MLENVTKMIHMPKNSVSNEMNAYAQLDTYEGNETLCTYTCLLSGGILAMSWTLWLYTIMLEMK